MERINERIVRLSLPLPFPLKWVHSYLIKGENGYTAIDAGLNVPEIREVWDESLKELGLEYKDIEKIILTHYHPDHYGLAGWLQEKTGAPVFMSEIDHLATKKYWTRSLRYGEKLRDFYIAHGMPAGEAEAMIPHMEQFAEWVEPHPEVQYISEGERVRIGDDTYEAIWTPGHAEGHFCFYRAESKEIFAGDHLLPRITPNISYMPDGPANPLEQFLSSLRKMKQIPMDVAYPSHGPVFTEIQVRIVQLEEHHEERLIALSSQITASTPQNAYDLCQSMFGDKLLSTHQWRFAMSEVIAHILYLVSQGRILEAFDGKLYTYSRSNK